MTARRALALFVMEKLAVLAVLCLDLGLFLGPRTDSLAVLQVGEQWTGRVFMFRTQDPECSYSGPDTNYDTFWLPQWDCTPIETARYALVAGVVLCGLVVVFAPKRTDTLGATWVLLGSQTVASAATLLECVLGNWTSAVIWLLWVPLLVAVAFWRAPTLWRRRIGVATVLVVAASGAYVVGRLCLQPAANPPHWRRGSWGVSGVLGTYWFAQQLVVLPLFGAVVRLVTRSAASADLRRVTTAVVVVALATAGVALIAQGLSGPPRFVVVYRETFTPIAAALAFAVLAAACQRGGQRPAPTASPATPGGTRSDADETRAARRWTCAPPPFR